jgi:hypothetical protein
MLEYEDRTVQAVSACTCDRCGRRMLSDDYEWPEKLSVAWQGGYASTVGDGADVSIDLCQRCVKDTLGAWLRVTDPSSDREPS